jgi:hypothetical protein
VAGEETTVEIVFNLFPILAAEAADRAVRVCESTAERVLVDAELLINTPPRAGRLYRRGDRFHQASAPDEPPITDYGNLAASGYTKKIATAEHEVGFTAEYAKPLEYGTPRVKPRPFLRPSVEKEKPGFEEAMGAVARGE